MRRLKPTFNLRSERSLGKGGRGRTVRANRSARRSPQPYHWPDPFGKSVPAYQKESLSLKTHGLRQLQWDNPSRSRMHVPSSSLLDADVFGDKGLDKSPGPRPRSNPQAQSGAVSNSTWFIQHISLSCCVGFARIRYTSTTTPPNASPNRRRDQVPISPENMRRRSSENLPPFLFFFRLVRARFRRT